MKNPLELDKIYLSSGDTNHVTEHELAELSHKDQVRFALFCANQTIHHWHNSDACMDAIKVVEMFIEDEVTSEYCEKVQDVFFMKHEYKQGVVFYALATTHFCKYANYMPASHNAFTAGKWAIQLPPLHKTKYEIAKAQRDYYNELRYIDNIFERIVLESNV